MEVLPKFKNLLEVRTKYGKEKNYNIEASKLNTSGTVGFAVQYAAT